MSTTSSELATLIHRSASGDRRAFAEFFDATAARVYGAALGILGSPALAEKAAQTSYLELWRTAGTFQADRCSPVGWITLTLHQAIHEGDPNMS